MKHLVATSLLISLVFISSFLHSAMAVSVSEPPAMAPAPTPGYCDMKCGERCGKAGYKERCLKYCGICCKECKCVPSGTHGNKSECPCYRDKKNSHGTSKCP